MREHSSYRLADADELEHRRAASGRPLGRVRMLVATATHGTLVAPLLACNPKGICDGGCYESPETFGSETWEGDGDGDWDGDEGDGDGDGDGDTFEPCPKLSVPLGEKLVVGPEQAAELPAIVAAAEPYTIIALLDGTYDLSGAGPIRLSKEGIELYSLSSDPEAVRLSGGDVLDELLVLEASWTGVAHVTLEGANSHAIRVTGTQDANTIGTWIYNVVVHDPGKQAIVVNRSDTGYFADQGWIACSDLQMSDEARDALVDCEIAGIDARGAEFWVVSDNHLEGWWCAEGLAQPAIHFWKGSRNTLVERNTVHDSAQGIGFGYGEFGVGDERTYDDDPCPESPGHIGGIIRNNMIWTGRPELFDSVSGVVSGISLDNACAAQVHYNTVVSLERPRVSIEYRWAGTDAAFANNLVTHSILPIGGAQAQLDGNMDHASLDNFVQPQTGDLHLAPSSPAIDAGVDLYLGVYDDIDRQPRVAPMDVGADEYEG